MCTSRTQEDDRARVLRAEAIARLNDELRVQGRGGSIMVTSGVRAVDGFNVQLLLHLLASYDRFDADNDPHGERDFGDLAFTGADLLWKIDLYEERFVKTVLLDPLAPTPWSLHAANQSVWAAACTFTNPKGHSGIELISTEAG